LERARAEAEVIGCCDAICASNPVEAEQLVEFYGASLDRIELVPPGVDHAFFSPGSRSGARHALGLSDDPTVLFVGRIQPLKGLEVAVRAVAASADERVRLVVVGGASGADGPQEYDRVRKIVSDLGLTHRVRFVPPQPHHQLSTWYRSADVVVVPSRSESFGLVALEAAACGVPVVAAAVGGLRSLVDHGRTGFLVDSRDPNEFATRIDQILNNDDLSAQMSETAAARAMTFSWSVTAGRLRRLFADLSARSLVECP
jgi:D-inositol-3-phosphate glycosyltransferase